MTDGQPTMDKTKERAERPGQPEPLVDYFLVVAHFEEWYVSREMAQAIEASLNETRQWVVFVDLTGARVRVRSRTWTGRRTRSRRIARRSPPIRGWHTRTAT